MIIITIINKGIIKEFNNYLIIKFQFHMYYHYNGKVFTVIKLGLNF